MILSVKVLLITVLIQLSNNEYRYTLKDDNILKENLSSLDIEVVKFQNNDNIDLDMYELVVKNKEYYFINILSGLVYKIKNNILDRIDNSQDNRLLKDSYIFKHNDTIFRYGGYGFWSQRNFIIYYDESINEWEIYNTRDDSYSPTGSYKGIYFKNKDDIYFIGGEKVDETNRLESIKNEDVIKFNFNNKSFKYLGKLNFNFNVYSLIVKDDEGFVVNNGSQIAYVKPLENKVLLYNKTPLQLNLYTPQDEIVRNYFFKKSYYLEVLDNQNLETNIFKVSKSNFFKNEIKESRLYNRKIEDSINLSTLFIIIILITLTLVIYDKRRFNKIIISHKGIIYRRVLNKLNQKEINIIIQLINNEAITTQTILNIVENPNLSYPHNIKLKEQFLRELNLKLKTIFIINYDPIIVKKSKNDARIKEYSYRDEFKDIVKRSSINT